jgi:hypothetical protein
LMTLEGALGAKSISIAAGTTLRLPCGG